MDLTEVRAALCSVMRDPRHDDGSLAPLFIRFAWHQCGTYSKLSGDGGSNGCTFRFDAEAQDPENNGLAKAKHVLETVKRKFPWLSYSDLYVLAGTVAIEYAGGPRIPFSTGRKDLTPEQAENKYGPSKCPFGDGEFNPCKSRLPAADLGPDPDAPEDAPMHVKEAPTINAVRNTFRRMGFSDKETVCLIILGHQFGRCHPEVSGYEHAWYGFDPAHWNAYLHGLGYPSVYGMLDRMYSQVETTAGKRQWEMFFGGAKWMMLPSDMALWWDPAFRKHVQFYDRDRRAFHNDAVKVWKKLIELGCTDLEPEITPTPGPRTHVH